MQFYITYILICLRVSISTATILIHSNTTCKASIKMHIKICHWIIIYDRVQFTNISQSTTFAHNQVFQCYFLVIVIHLLGTRLWYINNSSLQLNCVCLQLWCTRKYNVKILILCARWNLYLRPPLFFIYQACTPMIFSAMKLHVWLITDLFRSLGW